MDPASILVIAVILGLLGDVITKGRVSATLRGTSTGAARTGYRAAVGGISAGMDATRAGRGTKAAAVGVRDGVRTELARLPAATRQGRATAEQARVDAQDPVKGARPGAFGRSFDRAPTVVVITVDGDRVDVLQTPHPGARRPPKPKPTDPAAAPAAATTTPEGAPDMPPTAAAATPTSSRGPARPTAPPGAAPSVRVESLPGFIAAVRGAADLVAEISEQATANLHLGPEAQTGLSDVIDTLRTVAKTAHETYNPLVEAADGTPKGAEGVTVGQARTE